jgi:2-polyprenyl-3-methyl-5-hydroxy-6-metoxy-1,4-benzoquinol methylase
VRFHVVALPHTNVSDEHVSCAFNQKTLKFCRMMMGLGHEVTLYSSEITDAEVTEHVVCISEAERVACLEGRHYTEASFDATKPHWQQFNARVAHEMACQRLQDRDFICLIGGLANKAIADAFPGHMVVEYGIGYPGPFAPYQVFESYAWMHTTYGAQQGNANALGGFYHDVIPSYFEPKDFPVSHPEDYYLYIGRLTDNKGWHIAQDVCQHRNARLIVAGPGHFSGYGEYVGEVGVKERGTLMAGAIATFVPTLYIEPFGSVHAESMMCGTPVITTDWGVFVETVENGKQGFRCRTFAEFCQAAEDVKALDRKAIRKYARSKFSMDVVAQQYERYFSKLLTLWDDGFYTLPDGRYERPVSPEIYDAGFYQMVNDTETEQADRLGALLMRLYSPWSVIDIGCASGLYLKPFLEAGVAIDGYDYSDDAFADDVRRVPLKHLEKLDITAHPIRREAELALCIEVLEHIPEADAEIAVQHIAETSDLLVVTAAPPGQAGTGHVNCQPKDYWEALFAEHGFARDGADELLIRSVMAAGYHLPWLTENLMVFKRGG